MRNEIYYHALGASDLTISYHCSDFAFGKAIALRRNPRDINHASHTSLNSALVLANKQIYNETYGMLYRQPLHFSDVAALHTFLLAIGQEHRDMLTDITIRTWSFGYPLNRGCLELLAKTTNLARLRVQCDNCTGPGLVSICASQSACWDFGNWVEAVGFGKDYEDSDFVTERLEDGEGFCYSRTWERKQLSTTESC